MPHLPSKRRRKVYSVRGCATRIRQPSVPFAGRQQTDEMSSVDWCWIDPMDREHYYRRNLISAGVLTWEKWAREESHCCGRSACCYCRMTGWRASKSTEPPTRGIAWKGRVPSVMQRGTQQSFTRAWLFCIRSRMRNPRKHSAMPRQEMAVASWRIGPGDDGIPPDVEPYPGPAELHAALPKSKERAN